MEILLVPNEVLRLKAQKLTKITKEDINIAHQMMNTMIKAPGVGLAAANPTPGALIIVFII